MIKMKNIKTIIIKLNKILLLILYSMYLYRWFGTYRYYELNSGSSFLILGDIFRFIILLSCIVILFVRNRRVIISASGLIVFLCWLLLPFLLSTYLPFSLTGGIPSDKILAIMLIMSAFLCFIEITYSNWKILTAPRNKVSKIIEQMETESVEDCSKTVDKNNIIKN